MSGMATLFERYRIVEAARTELVAAALERLAAATARCFDRVSTRSVGDALRPLNTHADFFRVVGEDTKARIATLHEAKAAAERASAASHAPHHHVQATGKGAAGVTVAAGGAGSAAASPAAAATGSASSVAPAVPAVSVSPRDAVANAWLYGNSIGPRPASASNAGEAGPRVAADSADAGAAPSTTGSRSRRSSGAAAAAAGAAEDAGSSGSGASGGGSSSVGGGRRRSHPLVSAFHFELEPLPLVMTPLSSPLVVRVGRLMRQVGMMKTWKPFVGVLTRDGFLYLLQIDSDAAGAGTSGSGSGSSSSSSSSSAAAGDDLATHPDVLHAVLKWSAERLSVSTHGVPASQLSPASAAAASTAAPSSSAAGASSASAGSTGAFAVSGPAAAPIADVDSGIAGAPPLPAPALPPQLMAMAAAYAGNVSDLLLAEEGEVEAEADGRRRANARGSGSSSSAGGKSAAVSSALLDRARKADRAPGTNFPITASVKLAFAPAVHADAFEISDRSGFLGMTHKLLLRATTPDDAVDWVVALNKAQELVALGTGAAATGGEP